LGGEIKFQLNEGGIAGSLTIESEDDGNIQVDRNILAVGGEFNLTAEFGKARVFLNDFGGVSAASFTTTTGSCKSFDNTQTVVDDMCDP